MKAKNIIPVILAAALLLGCFAVYSSAADDLPYATLLTASDFQKSSSAAVSRLSAILRVARADGVTVDGGFFGGDYATSSGVWPDEVVGSIRDTVEYYYTGVTDDELIFVEGNHDVMGANIAPTGLHDLGSCYVYSINEDDFFKSEGSDTLMYAEHAIRSLAARLKTSLDRIASSSDKRPVFVVTHVPLHHTRRGSYADNLYAKYIFDVLNEAGGKLDIVFAFGHNHSSNYDDYIGGSLNFIPKGGKIRIPVPSRESAGENGYTEETLGFTYMNCGYVGYNRNTASDTSVNVLAASFIRLYADRMEVLRYTEDGLYKVEKISKINENRAVATRCKDAPVMTCPETEFTSGVSALTEGMSYVIASDEAGDDVFAARDYTFSCGKKADSVMADEGVAAVASGAFSSITTSDPHVIYKAVALGGKVYLRSIETGKYISTRSYKADADYPNGRVNIELVSEKDLSDNAVCSVVNGQLKVGSYFIHHSDSHYFYAKSADADQALYEGRYTGPEAYASSGCNHICHKGGLLRIVWIIINFINRLFGVNRYCECGAQHY